MQLVPEGLPCECGNRGCWEQYCSGHALVRAARARVAAGSPASALLRELADEDAGHLSGPTVTRAAERGDPASIELLAHVGLWLGVGVAALSAAFDPELVIVGG